METHTVMGCMDLMYCWVFLCILIHFWCSLMEQKTDWLKEASAELTRRLQDREASAQKIKRCCAPWYEHDDDALLNHHVCPALNVLDAVG